MKRQLLNRRPDRAYTNTKFLLSADARTLRILSEFIEPHARFRHQKIRDTVVFFGSARVKPPEIARDRLKKIKNRLKQSKTQSASLLSALEDAKLDYTFSRYYDDARKLSKMLTKWSRALDQDRRLVICSGGGPGIMEAANRGAIQAGGKSIGLNITLPFEQSSNPYITPDLNFLFHYFFMRKFWFVYLAKAMVIFPGGFGTMDELMEVLTLVQTKKVTKPLALVIFGKQYWEEILNFNALVKYKMISPKDLKLFKIVDSPEEAFEYLKEKLGPTFR